MGKNWNAKDMLRSGQRAAGTRPAEQDAEPASELGDEVPSELVTVTTSELVTKLPTYQRATVYLTPEQRDWLRQTAKALPVDGLSGSDVARLAIARLRQDVEDGLDLVGELTNQAHEEATTLAGRRNRGLPPR